jgi:hypothetical protein
LDLNGWLRPQTSRRRRHSFRDCQSHDRQRNHADIQRDRVERRRHILWRTYRRAHQRLIRESPEAWLRFASTTAPDDIFIAHSLSVPWLLSVQHPGVAREFRPSALPGPGVSTQVFPNLTELHGAIARTYQLSVSLPQLPLQSFEEQTAALPRETEAERVVIRQALMEYWNGTCPLTGITDPALLRASHIVPWAECENDALRLNVYNGLLLSSLWDAAFDAGLISFTADGPPSCRPHSAAGRPQLSG